MSDLKSLEKKLTSNLKSVLFQMINTELKLADRLRSM